MPAATSSAWPSYCSNFSQANCPLPASRNLRFCFVSSTRRRAAPPRLLDPSARSSRRSWRARCRRQPTIATHPREAGPQPPGPQPPGPRLGAAAPAGLRLGAAAPNPFYAHLFQAWDRSRGDLQREIQRWRDRADPLESGRQIGLTPFGTYEVHGAEIEAHMDREPGPTVDSFDGLRYAAEQRGGEELRRFLAQFPELPQRNRSPAQWRELWILLGSYRDLFLDADAGDN